MFFLQIQDTIGVDTTSVRYQIGHTIGGWIPYILLVIIFILIIRKQYKFTK